MALRRRTDTGMFSCQSLFLQSKDPIFFPRWLPNGGCSKGMGTCYCRSEGRGRRRTWCILFSLELVSVSSRLGDYSGCCLLVVVVLLPGIGFEFGYFGGCGFTGRMSLKSGGRRSSGERPKRVSFCGLLFNLRIAIDIRKYSSSIGQLTVDLRIEE